MSEPEDKRTAIGALYDYMAGLTSAITHSLRIGRCSRKEFEDVELISSLMRDKKFNKPLYRCTDWDILNKYWSITKENAKGTKYVDKGFISTAYSEDACFTLYPKNKTTVLMEITSDKPIKGVDMKDTLGDRYLDPEQEEFLIEHGMTLLITDVGENEKMYTMKVSIL